MGRLLLGFLRKDAKLFLVDRQAVVMSFIIPILVASILGWLDVTAAKPSPNQRVSFILADNDQSDVSRAVVKKLQADDSVIPSLLPESEAREKAKNGGVVAILPSGFGKAAARAMGGGKKPTILLLTDPAKPTDAQVVKGALIGDSSGVVAKAVYGALAGDATAPLEVTEQTSAANQVRWGDAAHDFAGFGLMGLLFFAIESAVVLVRDRRLGIWRRLRASPVSPWVFILSRGVSSSVIALTITAAMFGFGALVYGIRILGSFPGFILVALATALMCATFGLFIATFGKSENQARGVSILFIFLMLATGGAWFPLSRMPDWIQHVALYLPVRWSVEGFDAMTWRGLGLNDALRYSGALSGFAFVFACLSLIGFKRLART